MKLNSEKKIKFIVTDMAGSIIMIKKATGDIGNNQFLLKEDSSLPTWIYYLTAIGVDAEDVKKIIIK